MRRHGHALPWRFAAAPKASRPIGQISNHKETQIDGSAMAQHEPRVANSEGNWRGPPELAGIAPGPTSATWPPRDASSECVKADAWFDTRPPAAAPSSKLTPRLSPPYQRRCLVLGVRISGQLGSWHANASRKNQRDACHWKTARRLKARIPNPEHQPSQTDADTPNLGLSQRGCGKGENPCISSPASSTAPSLSSASPRPQHHSASSPRWPLRPY